jgi:hypothetical protein
LVPFMKNTAPPFGVRSVSPSVYSVPAAEPARIVTPSETFDESISEPPELDRNSRIETCVEPAPGETYAPLASTACTTSARTVLSAWSALICWFATCFGPLIGIYDFGW